MAPRPGPDAIGAARAARDEVRRRLAGVDGVVAIGLTRDGAGRYAVKVDVARPGPHGLPGEIDGVPVVVAVTGRAARLARPADGPQRPG